MWLISQTKLQNFRDEKVSTWGQCVWLKTWRFLFVGQEWSTVCSKVSKIAIFRDSMKQFLWEGEKCAKQGNAACSLASRAVVCFVFRDRGIHIGGWFNVFSELVDCSSVQFYDDDDDVTAQRRATQQPFVAAWPRTNRLRSAAVGTQRKARPLIIFCVVVFNTRAFLVCVVYCITATPRWLSAARSGDLSESRWSRFYEYSGVKYVRTYRARMPREISDVLHFFKPILLSFLFSIIFFFFSFLRFLWF